MKNLVVIQSKQTFFSKLKASYSFLLLRFYHSDYFDFFVFLRNLCVFLFSHPRDLVAFFGICFLAIFKNFFVFFKTFVFLSVLVFSVSFLYSFLI